MTHLTAPQAAVLPDVVHNLVFVRGDEFYRLDIWTGDNYPETSIVQQLIDGGWAEVDAEPAPGSTKVRVSATAAGLAAFEAAERREGLRR